MPPDEVIKEGEVSLDAPTTEEATADGKRDVTSAKKYAKMMLYTHPKVARKIKQIALDNDRKANDVILDALDLYFAQHGHVGLRHVIESKG